jgi:chromosome partitioning protein
MINQKGGVGKTTNALLAAEHMADAGRTVLLIDFDPLGTASDIMLAKYAQGPQNYTAAAWIGDQTDGRCVPWTHLRDRLALIPADNGLEDVLVAMSKDEQKVFDLRMKISQELQGFWDVVVIDAPPSLSALAWAAIIAADLLVVPTLPDMTSVKGLRNVMRQIDDLRGQLGMAPALIGVVANMVNARITKHREALAALQADGMPPLLGMLPLRQGRDAWTELRAAYTPIAQALAAAMPARVPA